LRYSAQFPPLRPDISVELLVEFASISAWTLGQVIIISLVWVN